MEISEGSGNFLFSILFTPKFHCEIAGEGIKYSWGVSKKIYRKKTFQEKRTFSAFVNLVKESLDAVTVDMTRMFLAKARRYMVGYYHQWKEQTVAVALGDPLLILDAKPSLIKNEKLHKMYKSHRDVGTSEKGYIERVMSECIRL